MIGSKLLYILVTYDFEYIISSLKNRNFEFLGGSGTVFYGGLIFGIIGTSLTMCLFGLDFRIFEKHIVPYIPLGHAVGRIGCLLAGCCYGMEYSGIGAVRYPNALTGLSPDTGYFPVQPMESVLDLVIMAMLIIFAKKKRQKGDILCLYLMLYAITRIITEAFRGDVHRGVFWGISTSQWISIALILFVFTRRIYRKIAKKE